ncbi:MAG: MFS transporter [Cyanobacteria bacterium]|nr:MFS transporter [Cyanobacteria bacterium CG_2015-16_32_12]NCO77341.1 MFS transporter [Cyanobacteria bacterium CG_2015-22_32_23]NCQ04122.1 MFS transporter [Cyanobacteria bacterium CG_2015-09_32_10]NCQ42539.1 MFS transporter [Cyanobacteria bacterium CG_2015-04_32_10]NCS83877.1 MFS transporter [Cyanobacteria bacterium CG_2015-02_32_10]
MSSNQLSEKLNLTTKLAFGAGDIGPALTANILVFFLMPFFTNVAGLSPGVAGSILFVGKIADAINDPIIGVFSDRTQTKWGRRIPWIIIAAIPFGVTFFLQWIVPNFSDNSSLNNTLLFIYYLIIGIVFNLFYTAVNLPYQALTPELTQDYNERTSLNSFRFSFSIGASILSLILAGAIFQVYQGNNQEKYLVLGIISTIFSTLPLFWCPLIVKERGYQPLLNYKQRKITAYILITIATILVIFGLINLVNSTSGEDTFSAAMYLLVALFISIISISLIIAKTEPHLLQELTINPDDNSSSTIPFFEQLKIVFQNKPFLYVVGIYLCSWLAVQLTASILLYFVVNWMGLPDAQFPRVAIAVQGTALIMLFVWQKISNKLDKKIVYFLGSTIWIIAQIGLFLVQPGQTFLLYALAMLAGCGVSVAYLIPWSMIPDVIDLDELNTGERREGLFYGFMVLLQKFGLAFGLFLVGIALEASGFIKPIEGEAIPIQPESALWAIRLVVAPLPAVILLAGIILAYFYPITREYYAEIRLKLDERKRD